MDTFTNLGEIAGACVVIAAMIAGIFGVVGIYVCLLKEEKRRKNNPDCKSLN